MSVKIADGTPSAYYGAVQGCHQALRIRACRVGIIRRR